MRTMIFVTWGCLLVPVALARTVDNHLLADLAPASTADSLGGGLTLATDLVQTPDTAESNPSRLFRRANEEHQAGQQETAPASSQLQPAVDSRSGHGDPIWKGNDAATEQRRIVADRAMDLVEQEESQNSHRQPDPPQQSRMSRAERRAAERQSQRRQTGNIEQRPGESQMDYLRRLLREHDRTLRQILPRLLQGHNFMGLSPQSREAIRASGDERVMANLHGHLHVVTEDAERLKNYYLSDRLEAAYEGLSPSFVSRARRLGLAGLGEHTDLAGQLLQRYKDEGGHPRRMPRESQRNAPGNDQRDPSMSAVQCHRCREELEASNGIHSSCGHLYHLRCLERSGGMVSYAFCPTCPEMGVHALARKRYATARQVMNPSHDLRHQALQDAPAASYLDRLDSHKSIAPNAAAESLQRGASGPVGTNGEAAPLPRRLQQQLLDKQANVDADNQHRFTNGRGGWYMAGMHPPEQPQMQLNGRKQPVTKKFYKMMHAIHTTSPYHTVDFSAPGESHEDLVHFGAINRVPTWFAQEYRRAHAPQQS